MRTKTYLRYFGEENFSSRVSHPFNPAIRDLIAIGWGFNRLRMSGFTLLFNSAEPGAIV